MKFIVTTTTHEAEDCPQQIPQDLSSIHSPKRAMTANQPTPQNAHSTINLRAIYHSKTKTNTPKNLHPSLHIIINPVHHTRTLSTVDRALPLRRLKAALAE
jgi:hypothetical protein